jgi:hypothetical protein
MHFAIIIVIIIIIIIIIYNRIHANKLQKYNYLAHIDTPHARENAERNIYNGDHNMSADDLFTLSLIHLHRADDALDSQNTKLWDWHMLNTRQLLNRAIVARTTEHENTHVDIHNDVVTNATIVARANDVGIPAQPIINTVKLRIPTIVHRWTSDAENVHDSAVGDDVARRITFLREHDLRIYSTNMCAGVILLAMSTNHDISQSPNAEHIRDQVRATLKVMKADAYCSRYQITELEALRLTLERIYSAPEPEISQNIEAAIVRAIADCSQDNDNDTKMSTVCLVGRITRIIGALDEIDPGMPPALKTTDAYRAEIMNKLGMYTRQQTEKGADLTRDGIRTIIEEYRTILPAHVFTIIETECYAAL